MRAMMPLLLRSQTRTILNVSSAGANMLLPGVLGYQTSKTAVTRLTEFTAKEYESENLIAIAVHPGDVLTDLSSGIPEEWLHLFDYKPDLAGDALVWLAKERRDWLNGRFVNAPWDMKELEAKKNEITAGDLLKFRLTV
jgi:NAD(P)-dependent dehydrogenase (short-subunit alcohol dehydrogenase family)